MGCLASAKLIDSYIENFNLNYSLILILKNYIEIKKDTNYFNPHLFRLYFLTNKIYQLFFP